MKYFILTILFLSLSWQGSISQDTEHEKTTYKVEKGEGVYTIAKKLGVSLADLRKWNNLTEGSTIYPGQKLTVYIERDTPAPERETGEIQVAHTHTVEAGESLYAISRKWNVSVSDLQKWNELEDYNIRAGQQLIIYNNGNASVFEHEEDWFHDDDKPAVEPLITFATQQRILFFGDSMIEGLNKRMRQYAAENDHDVLNVIWYSSSTKWWAQHSDTITHFINTFDPTYIVICLGANELFIKNVQSRDTYVKEILGKLGDLPYAWVGPPNWKEDTGINDLIRKNVGEERFFASKDHKFRRTKDGAHLPRSEADRWMDMIAQWLNNDVPEPLLMNVPSNENKMRGKNKLLMPLKK
jgi:FOG: LysM repeat